MHTCNLIISTVLHLHACSLFISSGGEIIPYKTLGSIQKFSLRLPEREVTVHFSVVVEIFLLDIESETYSGFS